MRHAWLLLIVTGLAGCADDDPATSASEFPLEVYRFAYEGSDVAVAGVEHGWLLRITNPTDDAYRTTILPFGLQDALLGPVGGTTGDSPQTVFLPARIENGKTTAPVALDLAPGESGVFLVKVAAYPETGAQQVGFRAFAAPAHAPERLSAAHVEQWTVDVVPATTAVVPGDHVQTATVGVWINGTSFYTNIADLHADVDFPKGYPLADEDPTPLPIYVYGNDRTEQPAASEDRCHFTTIVGYNALLKEQAQGSTGVRLLRPEDAYTVEGNQGHFLYGEPLIFLNTVVAHDGSTTLLDEVPDPAGACFDITHALPPLPIS